MAITIVYGPMRCGKTRNRRALMDKYPHANFVDSWFGQPLADDTLVLTHLEPPFKTHNGRKVKFAVSDVRVVSFEEAMK